MEGHPFRAFLGFLFTFLLTILLLLNGILLPLKSTILRGNGINDVIVNNGIYSSAKDILIESFMDSENPESAEVSAEAIGQLLDTELMETMGKEITEALINGDEVDFSAVTDTLADKVEEGLRDTIDKTFEEIQASGISVVSSDVIKENGAVKEFQNEFGMDISDMITGVIMEQYGQESIDLNRVDIADAKKEVNSYMEENIYPEIPKFIEKSMEEASSQLNKEIKESVIGSDAQKTLKMVDEGIGFSTTLLYIILASIAGLVLIEVLIYKPCIYRAFRNIYISLILPSITTILAGVGAIALIPMIMNEMNLDKEEQMAMDLFNKVFSRFANAILITGIVYIVLFVILVVLASRFKAIYNKTQEEC